MRTPKADRAALVRRLEQAPTDWSIGTFLDELIRNKVALESFSNTTQIVGLIDDIGLEISGRADLMVPLSEMIARRHEIVHHADTFKEDGRVVVALLEHETVAGWLANAQLFGEEVIGALAILIDQSRKQGDPEPNEQ